ncbi:MAG: hypothetical protein J0H18_18810 [Rhizobiales bacterium]|nr:hypothetical protein [Hyphomicrobiales bacterium]OJY07888.1 MAG: hypothetical protein BGP07_02050 [Rhizobiales bacterium 63-22]
MMSIRPVMHSLSYELGEIALAYNAAVDFHKKLAAFDMVDDPDLWGWGTFYRTSRSRAELAATAAQRSLDRAKLRRPQIDAVVICGASFPESTSDQARLCNDILSRLDLEHCFVIGASLLRCNSMLASIQVGAALVQSGMYRHALVIACDRVEDEAGRFQNFALFSDSSASCILSADNRAGYKLLSFATASNPKEMSREGEISGNLGRIATEETLLGTDIEPHNVSKVFPPNLLRPIILFKERQAGFSPEQLFLDNIPLRSHCFTADCIINLRDCEERAPFPEGSKIILCSSVSGFRSVLFFESKTKSDLGSATEERAIASAESTSHQIRAARRRSCQNKGDGQ